MCCRAFATVGAEKDSSSAVAGIVLYDHALATATGQLGDHSPYADLNLGTRFKPEQKNCLNRTPQAPVCFFTLVRNSRLRIKRCR
jgi:hypothetical protein